MKYRAVRDCVLVFRLAVYICWPVLYFGTVFVPNKNTAVGNVLNQRLFICEQYQIYTTSWNGPLLIFESSCSVLPV